MFESLNKILRIETVPFETLDTIHADIVTGGAGVANFSFLTHHFISYYLKQNNKVCLVSCSQTLTHHKVIQQKLGNNLVKLTSEGKFDIVSVPGLMSIHGVDCLATNSCSTQKSCFSNLINLLYDSIATTLEKLQGSDKTTPCLLVLDDLSVLNDIGISTTEILLLICRIKSSLTQYYNSMMTTCCQFNTDNTSLELCALSNQLTHWSKLSFTVDDLVTGLSKDVHGQLKVRWMNKQSVQRPQEDLYHYKMTDRDLKMFAVGASPAVL